MELWTPMHTKTLIPALIVMLVAAAVLRLTIGKKPLKIRMIPMQVIACLLVLLEIGKQAVSFSKGYDLYHIPLHFCSLFIFMIPAMAFYMGKYARQVRAITSALAASMFLLMIIYPNLIYSAGNVENFFKSFLDMHTVAFHNLVMFAFFLMVALDLHTPEKGESKPVLGFTFVYCVIAASAAQLLKTNFNNFYSCNIPPLENLRVSLQGTLGYGVTQLLYVLIVTVLDLLFVLGCYWLYVLLRSVFHKQKQPAVK